jgi:hypothetical protein
LDEATKKLLDESKNSKWETRAELKTSAK